MNFTEMVRRLTCIDLVLVKLSSLLFGIAIGAYFSSTFAGYELWLVVLALLAAIKPIRTGYFRKSLQPAGDGSARTE